MQNDENDVKAEYDFDSMAASILGRHFAKYRKYLRTVELDERLANRFHDSQSVLDAFRRVADEPTTSSTGG